jgi:hypothetical protein
MTNDGGSVSWNRSSSDRMELRSPKVEVEHHVETKGETPDHYIFCIPANCLPL